MDEFQFYEIARQIDLSVAMYMALSAFLVSFYAFVSGILEGRIMLLVILAALMVMAYDYRQPISDAAERLQDQWLR